MFLFLLFNLIFIKVIKACSKRWESSFSIGCAPLSLCCALAALTALVIVTLYHTLSPPLLLLLLLLLLLPEDISTIAKFVVHRAAFLDVLPQRVVDLPLDVVHVLVPHRLLGLLHPCSVRCVCCAECGVEVVCVCGVAAQRAVLGGHEAAEQRVAVEEAGEGAGGLGGVVGTPQTEEGLGTHPVAGDTVDG